MKAVLDELTEFTDSYVEDDFLQKNRELFKEKEGQLDQQEKLAFLEHLSIEGSDVIFMIFCEEATVLYHVSQEL